MIKGAEHMLKSTKWKKLKNKKRLVTRPVPKQKHGDASVPPTENQ